MTRSQPLSGIALGAAEAVLGGAGASGPGDCGGGAAGKFPGRPRGAPSPGCHCRSAFGAVP